MESIDKKKKAYDELKSSFMLNGGQLFRSAFHKQRNHFFQGKVDNLDKSYFDVKPETVMWLDNYYFATHINEEQMESFEFIVDVKLSGLLSEYDDTGITFKSEPTEFSFAIHASFYNDGFGPDIRNITLLNSEQKALLLYHKEYEKELKRIEVKLLNQYNYFGQDPYSFFTRIWTSIDKASNQPNGGTDLYFFYELIECHRNIMFSVSNTNMWSRNKSHFLDNSYSFQGKRIYPVELTYKDNRYLYFIENSIEEIYTFYEKIAHLLYIFLNPDSITPKRLSFGSLFSPQTLGNILKKFPLLENNINLKWFESRALNQHKKLQNYRHPLVHYQVNEDIKGTYVASLTRLWMEKVSDETALASLFKRFEEIQDFVNSELLECKTCFEHCVLLIESLSAKRCETNS